VNTQEAAVDAKEELNVVLPIILGDKSIKVLNGFHLKADGEIIVDVEGGRIDIG
jgi:hypothetical protein